MVEGGAEQIKRKLGASTGLSGVNIFVICARSLLNSRVVTDVVEKICQTLLKPAQGEREVARVRNENWKLAQKRWPA